MDRLWSPWRLAYVTRGDNAGETGCVFCAAPGLPVTESLLVFAGDSCYVLLNLYPYNSGHLMVVPFRHVATLAGLTSAEMDELGRLTQRCEIALTEAYRPHGFNVGVNLGKSAGAGVLDHGTHARGPALERRQQLHDRGRRHARTARGPRRIRGAAPADLCQAGPEHSEELNVDELQADACALSMSATSPRRLKPTLYKTTSCRLPATD